MTYRWVDHTAELGLELEGASEADVFRDALAAFAELVEDEDRGEPASHAVRLEEPDRGSLLVAWLEELLYLADVDAFVPEQARPLTLSADGLDAVVHGRRGDPRPLVKAVTYHGVRFDREGDRWRAYVVLDV